MELPEPPAKLRQVAILQLASGLVNLVVMAAVVSLALGVGLGILGAACGCPSWACGVWGLALLPIGLVEAASGAVLLVSPESARSFARAAAFVEIASVAFGGFVSLVAGIAALSLLNDPDVAAWLEASR